MLPAPFLPGFGGIANNGPSSLRAMSFDRLAPHYRWMEFVLAGEKLQRCRTHFLDEIPEPRNILLLGEGPGRCLAECSRCFPNATITCLDASQRMLLEARKRLRRQNRGATNVEFIHANLLDCALPAGAYDLIITHFVLDCFRADQLEEIIPRLAAAASPDANWLIADFQMPAAGVKRIRSWMILRMMYAFFQAMTHLPAGKLTKPDSILNRSGFTLHRRAESEWDLLHSDWWRRLPVAL
jgi:ubiquinone/menaquinone biosynthesis C-methylase UbiE